MSGSAIGTLFKVTTFGESHGEALGCIVEGCPSGLALEAHHLQAYLDKRKPGQSRFTTQRRESDTVKILSGVFEGQTTGAPIALMIFNEDVKTKDYQDIQDQFRPGHADFTYFHKYGLRDWRGGGRASARETVARVAAGGIARHYLKTRVGIDIQAYLKQMGPIVLEEASLSTVSTSPFFSPDPDMNDALASLIETLRREGDSIGARVNVMVKGVPIGLGRPVFDKLSAKIAAALMSIPAAKGVEFGQGFDVITTLGSEHRDELTPQGFLSNHAGGMLGGISTGQEILASVAFKPTSSIVKPAKSINQNGEAVTISTKGRHDPCVGIRAVPIVEAMMALVLMDEWLCFRAYQNP